MALYLVTPKADNILAPRLRHPLNPWVYPVYSGRKTQDRIFLLPARHL